jgi:hypothetical protein
VQKELVNNPAADSIALYIVWIPMVPGDSESTSRRSGAIFPAKRVAQFFDPNHRVGEACVDDIFPDCLAQMIKTFPNDHPLYQQLVSIQADKSGKHPLWDAILCYPSGVEWTDRVPKPAFWSKQIDYSENGNSREFTGQFLKNDCSQAPVDSDWHRQVREAITKLLASGT